MGAQVYLTYAHRANIAYEIHISVAVLKPLVGTKNVLRPDFCLDKQ